MLVQVHRFAWLHYVIIFCTVVFEQIEIRAINVYQITQNITVDSRKISAEKERRRMSVTKRD